MPGVEGKADVATVAEAPSYFEELLSADSARRWPEVLAHNIQTRFHEFAALFESVTSAVSLFGHVANDMSPRRLVGKFAETCAMVAPQGHLDLCSVQQSVHCLAHGDHPIVILSIDR
jgi:hypothetical protein